MKNDQVMLNLMFMRQSGIWPIVCQLMAILAKLLDIDFKFVLPNININFNIQSDPNWPLYPQKYSEKSLKWPYLKATFCPSVIHQRAYSSYIFQWFCLKLSESI